MSTRIGRALRDLGDAIDAIESAGGEVTEVEPGSEGSAADGAIEVGMRVKYQLRSRDGPDGVELRLTDSSIDDDGSLVLDLVAATDADGRGASASTADQSPAGDDGSTDADGHVGGQSSDSPDDEPVPAYRDPDQLRAVYDAYDSFPEMTAALEVDVTPQTVRRHMIDHGIHEPGRAVDGDEESDAASDSGAETEWDDSEAAGASDDGAEGARDALDATNADARLGDAEVPPALGDLEGVSLDELKDAVRTSRTIREVGQRLGLPRERAFRLLNTLDLVDLVSGRLETADRPISAEELDQRIARAAAGE